MKMFHQPFFSFNPAVTTISLNLPRIATQSILGFGRWRLGKMSKLPLHSPAAVVLCFTEQLKSLAPIIILFPTGNSSHLFKKKSNLRSLNFLFAQELYCAVMKNDDLDSTPVQPNRLSSKSCAKDAPLYT